MPNLDELVQKIENAPPIDAAEAARSLEIVKAARDVLDMFIQMQEFANRQRMEPAGSAERKADYFHNYTLGLMEPFSTEQLAKMARGAEMAGGGMLKLAPLLKYEVMQRLAKEG